MSFTTSCFAVRSPGEEGKGEKMEVGDDAKVNAGAGMSGDTTDDESAQEPERLHRPPANVSESSHPPLTTRHSPAPSQKAEDSPCLEPDEPDPTSHQNASAELSETGTMATSKKTIKKKGTAASIKGPRSRGKGSSAAKKSGSKPSAAGVKKAKAGSASRRGSGSAAPASSSVHGDGGGDGDGGGSGSEEESGSDQGIYCICRGPDNHRFMIGCDRCEDWFHGDCIGMDKYTGENLVQRYICPNCTDGRLMVTRYKKTCALHRCDRPARMYGDVAAEEASIFCSDEHCQLWWEQLVGTLPRKSTGALYGDVLTQEEFMGLLGTGKKGGRKEGWQIGDEPFGVPPNFWDTTPPSQVLTEEESALLASSVSDRHSLGEEIVLCKKMLQLVDMAVKQRETLISASLGGPKSQLLGKDFCGYDYRLDTVGAAAPFAAFVRSPAGEAVFKGGRLPLPGDGEFVPLDGTEDGGRGGGVYVNGSGVNGGGTGTGAAGAAGAAAGLSGVMCVRRKCKPHAGWSGIHTKNVKHQIKELAAQAKEKLDFEARIRDCAAVRYQRRKREKNAVEVVQREVEMDG